MLSALHSLVKKPLDMPRIIEAVVSTFNEEGRRAYLAARAHDDGGELREATSPFQLSEPLVSCVCQDVVLCRDKRTMFVSLRAPWLNRTHIEPLESDA